MEKDNLGDWRIQAVTCLAKDVPAAYPGGPSHKAGTPVYLTTKVEDDSHKTIGYFHTPSPSALALGIANESAQRARRLWPTIASQVVVTPTGLGLSVVPENLPHLYDYFQLCMTVTVFCFQALEAFCNYAIATKLSGTYNLKRNRGHIKADAHTLQRRASTEEKLAEILPAILSVSSPRETHLWAQFQKLKEVRDATVHIKRSRGPNQIFDEHKLFSRFFQETIDEYLDNTIQIISHFIPSTGEFRWFSLAVEKINTK